MSWIMADKMSRTIRQLFIKILLSDVEAPILQIQIKEYPATISVFCANFMDTDMI